MTLLVSWSSRTNSLFVDLSSNLSSFLLQLSGIRLSSHLENFYTLGKIILITGANSGLGLEASTILSAKGAKIIMAVRNLEKGKDAVSNIINKNAH